MAVVVLPVIYYETDFKTDEFCPEPVKTGYKCVEGMTKSAVMAAECELEKKKQFKVLNDIS